MKNLILIGGGGHCKSVIDVIEAENKFQIIGILDIAENVGKSVLGYKVIGTDSMLEELNKNGNYFLITLGQIKSADVRINFFKQLKSIGANIATIYSPNSYVSRNSKIGIGTVIMHNCLVNADALIGENCIINTKAIVEHDVKIYNHCHISTASVVNGGCKIGEGTFIGSNSVILQSVEVGEKCLIGAGCIVINNVKPNQKVVGNPGKNI
jgi:sugar O-acyltransferase (sialic acid O-acetyltransferase NeuD family)